MTESEAIAGIEAAYALEMARGGSLSRIVEQSPVIAEFVKNVWMSGYALGYQAGTSSASEKLTRILSGVVNGA